MIQFFRVRHFFYICLLFRLLIQSLLVMCGHRWQAGRETPWAEPKSPGWHSVFGCSLLLFVPTYFVVLLKFMIHRPLSEVGNKTKGRAPLRGDLSYLVGRNRVTAPWPQPSQCRTPGGQPGQPGQQRQPSPLRAQSYTGHKRASQHLIDYTPTSKSPSRRCYLWSRPDTYKSKF